MPLPTASDTSIVICNSDVIVDTNADVNPTKGDIPTLSAADVYNSAVISVHDLYIPLTKGDASCVSFADYCVLGMDLVPPYFRPHFCDCTFSAGEGLVVVSLLSVSAPQAETDA